MITPEEMLIRGKGNFINCTDYDDAIEAMKLYAVEYHKAQANEPKPSYESVKGCSCKKLIDAYKMIVIKDLKIKELE